MFCKECGKEINDKAEMCVGCGCKVKKVSESSSAATRMLVPVDTSGMAIVSGYLGLLSVTMVCAPFAILFGFLGLRDIKNNPNKHGKGRCFFGIIMGALCSLIMGGILVSKLA